RVLWGGCDALFTPRPLGPFLDIAEEAGGELETAVNEGAPAVVAALLALARPGSATVVVVEDVHWADEATLDVLRLLARKLGQAPLLVLATYRDDEVDRVHPLRVLLGELATLPQAERLTVPSLSPEAVAELADSAEVDAVELHRAALGALGRPPGGAVDVARLAHHAEAAGDADAVLRYAPAAAERAEAVGAHREAAAHYARVLRFGERLSPAERAEFLERR